MMRTIVTQIHGIAPQVTIMAAAALLLAIPAVAAETNTNDMVPQLLRRIEELEQKVRKLEAEKQGPQSEKEVQAQKRVEELDQKVGALERQKKEEAEAAEARARTAPTITIGEKGFAMASANGDFGLQVRGVLQVDSRTFINEPSVTGDALLIRRARPLLQGTLFRDFDFLFMPDFAASSPQIFDAYLNYRYSPELQLTAGKFKSPIGLEQLQLDRDISFNERSLATALVPNRDIGFMLHGDLAGGAASYAAGIFDGIGDGDNNTLNGAVQNFKAYEGRLILQPFKPTALSVLKGLGFGLAGSYQKLQGTNTIDLPQTTGGTLPGFVTDGQQQFFAYNPTNKSAVVAQGEHWRLSPQGYYYWGPLSLLGEYVISDQQVTRTGVGAQPRARLANTAWEVTAGWVLTGENAAFKDRVIPRHNFNPAQGGWGALELVGRYAELHVDHAAFPTFSDPATSAREAKEWAVGLNWYLNRDLLLKTSFSHGTFEGGSSLKAISPPGIITRHDENVLFTRMQLAF